MTRKISLDRYEMILLYRKYKEFLIPLGVIAISLLLFIAILFPELQSILTDQQDNEQQVQKLTTMQNNVRLLSSLDDAQLTDQLRIATAALPVEKDYTGILSAISFAANKANVTLNDFDFSVGDLSTQAAGATPAISVDLRVNGDVNRVTAFVQELLAIVPLAQVKSLSLDNSSATIGVDFYYKVPGKPLSNDVALQPITRANLQLLSDLDSRRQQLLNTTPIFIGTPSAIQSVATESSRL